MDKKSHVLVCLSSSPSNQKIIREGAKLASYVGGDFTALFVETPQFQNWSLENRRRLEQNIEFARSMGANVETVFGEDVAFQIAEFSKYSGVTMLVIGRSVPVRMGWFIRPTLTDQLIALLPQMDIHIIPDSAISANPMPKAQRTRRIFGFSPRDILVSILILFAATVICFGLFGLNLSRANLIAVYILGVLLISMLTDYRIYSYVASLASVTLFNYFFTEPRFSLVASEQEYPITFLVMFLVSMFTGSLASRLKEQAQLSADAAFRTRVLLEANQELLHAGTAEDIGQAVINQVRRMTGLQTEVLPVHPEEADPDWVYFRFHSPRSEYGALRIRAAGVPLPLSVSGLIQSILGEAALALDNTYNRQEKEKVTLLAQKEQFRANILRSISHDLRTPLTSILGNVDNLINSEGSFDYPLRKEMYTYIRSDTQWLIELVENLLSISRMDEGQVQLRMSAELISDVVEEALQHIDRNAAEQRVQVRHEDSMMMAMMDSRLIVQVLINLLNNAIRHAGPGAQITIETRPAGNYAEITVSDNGEGIQPGEEERIFEMFYSGHTRISDSRRSMGLGLALCRSAVHAHKGTITAFNIQPHGAAFRFTLPIQEVRVFE